MNEKKPSALIILAVCGLALLMLTHAKEISSLPFVEVSGGEITVDVGDFHYQKDGA